MTAITIDKDKAIELLEKQVEKKGEDYVYTSEFDSCSYFADGTVAYKDKYDFDLSDEENQDAYPEEGSPLCIVGHVYADLGLTVDDLYYTTSRNYEGTKGQDGDLQDVQPDPEKVRMTEGAQWVLQEAQHAQDTGAPWGVALDAAQRAAKEAVA